MSEKLNQELDTISMKIKRGDELWDDMWERNDRNPGISIQKNMAKWKKERKVLVNRREEILKLMS